jgi:hypothetical protein
MDSKPSAITAMTPFDVPPLHSNPSLTSTSTLNVALATTDTAPGASASTAVLKEPIPDEGTCLGPTALKDVTIVVGPGINHDQTKVMIANFGGKVMINLSKNTSAFTNDPHSLSFTLFFLTLTSSFSSDYFVVVQGMTRRVFDKAQQKQVVIILLDTLIRYLSGQFKNSRLKDLPRISSFQSSSGYNESEVEWSLATACAQSNFEKNPALTEAELAILPDSAIDSK